MSTSKELENLLRQASPDVQQYVASLQSENLRLAKQLAKTEATLTTANSMLEVYKQGKTPNPVHYMSTEELMEIARSGKNQE